MTRARTVSPTCGRRFFSSPVGATIESILVVEGEEEEEEEERVGRPTREAQRWPLNMCTPGPKARDGSAGSRG